MKTDYRTPRTPLRYDPNHRESGVLLSDQIAYYARHHQLIQPFAASALRPAGYCLHVGDEFMIAGQRYNFEKQKLHDLTIQPYEVVVIKIKERVCLPRFLIGRWDIKVGLAYRGLMWVGGAQVDPGFKGHLYCPIYNLSNRPVRLKQEDELAVIDFVKTTPFKEGAEFTIEFDTEKHANRDFYDYSADQLESALIKQADDIEDVKAQAKSVDTRMTWFTTIVVSLLGLFGVSRFVGKGEFPTMDWQFVLLLLSGIFFLFLVARMLLLRDVASRSASVRWALRTLRIRPTGAFRIHFLWAYSVSMIMTVVFASFLYLIFANPFGQLEDRTVNLDARVTQIEEIVQNLRQGDRESTHRQDGGEAKSPSPTTE